MRTRFLLWLSLLSLGVSSFAGSALAQNNDVTGAARAFERARSAQLAERHPEAADLFELAYRLAPSPAALRSAIRNHLAAGTHDRAATLALVALREYPADSATRRAAEEALGNSSELARVRLACSEPCTVTVDSRAVAATEASRHDFFVRPGAHSFRARWSDGRTATTEATIEAGQSATLSLEPPAPEPEPDPPEDIELTPAVSPAAESTTPVALGAASSPAPPQDEGGGLPVWMTLTSAGITLALVGVTVWSGLDTLSARDEYEANPTQQTFDDGVAAETRTNILLGVTIGMGAVTAALAIFTDWDGEEELPVVAAFTDEGGMLSLRRSF